MTPPTPSIKRAEEDRGAITYSAGVANPVVRNLILAIENISGRRRLIRMADGYEQEVEAGRNFWAVMQERYGVELRYLRGGPEAIPQTGPVVIVANHPYGILDSLALGHLLSLRRMDFKVVANSVFNRVRDLDDHLVPICFDNDRNAIKMNLESRRMALEHLNNGGLVAIYPGGTVSTAARPFGPVMEPRWKNFTAKLVTQTDAAVIPIFFDGANTRLFQLASHVSQALRVSLLIREFGRRVHGPVDIAIGDPIDHNEIDARRRDPSVLMDYLRGATYALSPTPPTDLSYGWNGE